MKRPLPAGRYVVRIKVNGNMIPFYQYLSVDNADIWVSLKL
jgi:hypothetical protein